MMNIDEIIDLNQLQIKKIFTVFRYFANQCQFSEMQHCTFPFECETVKRAFQLKSQGVVIPISIYPFFFFMKFTFEHLSVKLRALEMIKFVIPFDQYKYGREKYRFFLWNKYEHQYELYYEHWFFNKQW